MKKLFLILLTIGLIVFPRVNHASAQTGCSVTPPTNTGKVILHADTTVTSGQTTATYRVWSRMKAADATNNSFYLQIDGNCPVLVQSSSTSFTWVPNTSNVTLTPGTHDITVIGNQPGVGVDKILMTKNLSCVPDNTIPPLPNNFAGLNCPAELITTPTPGVPDTTKPVISAVSAIKVTGTTVSIAWNLSEPATGQVYYGTTTAYGSSPTKETSFNYSNHEQAISGLTSGVTYHYRVESADQAGNISTSSDCTFIAGGAATQACGAAVATPTPVAATPTPIPPSTTVLHFPVLKLHGIGKGGDNSGSTVAVYPAPLTNQKNVTVDVIDRNGNTVTSATGTFTYSPTLGYYSGDIALPNTVVSDDYLIKIKAPKYLRKQISGIFRINSGVVNQITTTPPTPPITLIAGDINNDNSLNLPDYNIISDCYSDLAPAKNCTDPNKKAAADIFEDNKVNNNDYQLFIIELSTVNGD